MRRLLAAVIALFAVAPAHAQDAAWDAVVAAAKKEGSVAVYSALSGPPTVARFKAFEEKYGIRVDHFMARASEVTERVRIEQSAKRYIGDIYISSPATMPGRAINGELQPAMTVPNLVNLRDDIERDPNGVPVWYPPYGILANANLVKPDEITSWTDLLDPKWKGKMTGDDLHVGGSGAAFLEATWKTFGREFHEKLAKQDYVVTHNNREAERQVARGQYAIYFPQQLPYALALKGLPIRMIVPREGWVYASAHFALLTGAPHPNASRLLTQFMLEPDSQLVFANAGLIPVVKGVIEKASDETRQYLGAKLMGAASYANQEKMSAMAADIYK
jgi:ABC-type Fe3+ transport system substrate-binding protein